MDTKRKMAFFELHNGQLAIKTQDAFEEIQKAVFEVGQSGKVTLQIDVHPPEPNEEFGKINYTIQKGYPKEKSMKITTVLSREGLITNDGATKIDALQYDLDLKIKDAQIHQLNKGS